MRNDKLRNDLNNIPQDFDQDLLWNSIDLPKKQQKKRRGFWLFLVGLSLLGLLIFAFIGKELYYTDTQIEDKTIAQVSTQQEPLSNTSYQSNESNEENITDQNNSLTDIITKTASDLNSKSVDTENKKQIESDNSNLFDSEITSPQTNDKIVEKSHSGAEVAESTTITKNNLNNDESIEPDQLKSESSKTLKGISLAQPEINESITELAFIDKVKTLPVALLYISGLSSRNIIIENGFSKIKKIKKNNYSYGISVNSFLGKYNLDFGSQLNSADRTNNETALEALGLGVLGQLKIGQIELFSGLSYVKYNTHLKNTIQENTNFSSLLGPAKKKITTEYSLYNSYQYVDLVAGVGYHIPMGKKWRVVPSVQVGYSIMSKVDGDIFDINNELTALSSRDEYTQYSKWQGQANLKVERRINANWNLGIYSYFNTQKSLAQFENYSHKVSSYGLGVSISRNIN